jgi:hypothetical protein
LAQMNDGMLWNTTWKTDAERHVIFRRDFAERRHN